jgi:hypothetical protein
VCPAIPRLVPGRAGPRLALRPGHVQRGSEPDCINNDGHGVIPVAIVTSDTFDAATVKTVTVTLDGAGVRVKGNSGQTGSLEDVDNDGDLDLVVQIEDADGTDQAGDAVATLTGLTCSGMSIGAQDSLCIVP